jgi:hypothetical protein
MDVDQLRVAMTRISSGIEWTEGSGANKVNLFEDLAATLGKPDYLLSTQEDLSISPLFLKFLNDAGRFVCDGMVQRELTTVMESPIIFAHVNTTQTLETDPEAVNQNLRSLILRFHGRAMDANAPPMELWRWLFSSSTHLANDPVVGWRTVCVALFTHPDFFSY